MTKRVAIVGLGIIGGALATHLLDDGWQVDGADPDPAMRERARQLGAAVFEDVSALAADHALILTSLPSMDAARSVMTAIGDHAAPGTVVAELSTLSIAHKLALLGMARGPGLTLLDCPISGTGAQAAMRDIAIYASGDDAGLDRAEPALKAVSRVTFRLGAFGQGSRLKLVANLLVALHTLAAAEAMTLAQAVGLDLDTAIAALRAGAGNSRILELRAPMMAACRFEPVTMKLANWEKDLDAITAMAGDADVATPLLAASRPFFTAAARAFPELDTAAVFDILNHATID